MAEDKRGHHPADPPEKKHHAPNFDKALEDALKKWQPADGTEVTIEFQASITENPGGIKEYRIKLNRGG
jgi:hypothetical protein